MSFFTLVKNNPLFNGNSLIIVFRDVYTFSLDFVNS